MKCKCGSIHFQNGACAACGEKRTLQQIDTRLAAIRTEIETRGAELTADQLTALQAEVNELKEERKDITSANETRAALLASIAEGGAGTTVRTFPTPSAGSGETRTTDTYDDITESKEYRTAFMKHVLRNTPMPAEFRDAITMTTDVGAIIPQPVLNRIIEKMEAVGMILTRVTRTAYQGGLNIPYSTVKPVATWVGEGEGSPKQKKPVGNISFAYHKLRCKVAVTLEVDTMALSVFETTLVSNIVEAMTKALEQAIISGDGDGKPRGILAGVPDGVKRDNSQILTLTGAAPSYADLIAMEAALPIEYENSTEWCMSKKTFMDFIGMTDDTGQPIARVNMGIRGRPERTLLGRPVVLCNYVPSFMPNLTAGTVFAFLFNFSDYVLNTNYSMGIKRYEDNETDDRVTRAVMLADGRVVDENSLVTLARS